MIAIDSVSGKQIWASKTFEPTESKAITGAPRAFNNMVVIGHGGAEYGTRGYVSAYDADSGEQLWRFYTVPGNPSHGFENSAMEMAAATWFGEWWKTGGGGTVWDGITYDSTDSYTNIYIDQNGCDSTVVLNLFITESPSINQSDTTICYGQSVILSFDQNGFPACNLPSNLQTSLTDIDIFIMPSAYSTKIKTDFYI